MPWRVDPKREDGSRENSTMKVMATLVVRYVYTTEVESKLTR